MSYKRIGDLLFWEIMLISIGFILLLSINIIVLMTVYEMKYIEIVECKENVVIPDTYR
tara:strand:- start:384 stop:557 length:174 start_codon:yes stop_codon:yes gene_type:complete